MLLQNKGIIDKTDAVNFNMETMTFSQFGKYFKNDLYKSELINLFNSEKIVLEDILTFTKRGITKNDTSEKEGTSGIKVNSQVNGEEDKKNSLSVLKNTVDKKNNNTNLQILKETNNKSYSAEPNWNSHQLDEKNKFLFCSISTYNSYLLNYKNIREINTELRSQIINNLFYNISTFKKRFLQEIMLKTITPTYFKISEYKFQSKENFIELGRILITINQKTAQIANDHLHTKKIISQLIFNKNELMKSELEQNLFNLDDLNLNKKKYFIEKNTRNKILSLPKNVIYKESNPFHNIVYKINNIYFIDSKLNSNQTSNCKNLLLNKNGNKSKPENNLSISFNENTQTELLSKPNKVDGLKEKKGKISLSSAIIAAEIFMDLNGGKIIFKENLKDKESLQKWIEDKFKIKDLSKDGYAKLYCYSYKDKLKNKNPNNTDGAKKTRFKEIIKNRLIFSNEVTVVAIKELRLLLPLRVKRLPYNAK